MDDQSRDWMLLGRLVSDWYAVSHRDLPWRQTSDPYAILVSEIMLQQTRVETVVDYYDRFMQVFPTPIALAKDEADLILQLWKGLGYYSRARNLKKAAIMITDIYGGVMPSDRVQLLALPGVGDYTAGAILSIAFNKPVPAIDGNVLRVISRLDADDFDIGHSKAKDHFRQRIQHMIPENRAHDFCQGMMELGATVCSPATPKCTICPMNAFCTAYQKDLIMKFPVKRKKAPPIEVHYHTFVIRKDDFILFENRGDGLLKGMVGLPQLESESDVPDTDMLEEHFGIKVEATICLGSVTHLFTHRKWIMTVWQANGFMSNQELNHQDTEVIDKRRLFWHPYLDTHQLPIPTAFQKVLDMIES